MTRWYGWVQEAGPAVWGLMVTVVALTITTLAQSPSVPPPEVPALTEVSRLQLQNLAQRIELAQLRAQAAQRDFDTARDELGKLVVSLKVDGYTLDLQTLTYTKTPPPPKPVVPPPK
jgi:hypothetical protein